MWRGTRGCRRQGRAGRVTQRRRGVLRFGVRALRADPLHLLQGVAQFGQPVVGVPLHQSDAPGQGVTAAAGDPGRDERVEHLAFGLAKPGHDRRGDMREQGTLGAALHTPGDLLAELVLRLAGHLDAVLAGAFAELLDAGLEGRPLLGVRGAFGEPGLGDAADDRDLLTVDRHLRQALEEIVGQAAGEPAAQLLALLRCNHVITITPLRSMRKGRGGSPPSAEVEAACRLKRNVSGLLLSRVNPARWLSVPINNRSVTGLGRSNSVTSRH